MKKGFKVVYMGLWAFVLCYGPSFDMFYTCPFVENSTWYPQLFLILNQIPDFYAS